jgi:hypothetical protein
MGIAYAPHINEDFKEAGFKPNGIYLSLAL